ncbi:RNA polymerase sigma factor [Planctomyces sp. SH-PL62]|uniref:RNA polymerase sigma factor n=1 Tax=Planctomyces sp. SH-PL62 TaxID=1636152 RepID=UPI00078D05A5|nr:sigma-70 family RNA polymerase sigma factor [Planctomyces sp. SH-PL62]AMV36334.1 RNA polymerase sigma factor [Planctomyces sp. SH-PL62]
MSTPEERLTEIQTNWTTITSAHGPGPNSQQAMGELVGRYHDALTRYIHLKVRDRHLADEVLQEFWTKLLTGKLAGADKTKGRFRDYLRTVLHRLIIDHFRTRKLQALPPGDLLDASQPDEDFDRVWREAVLNRVWSRLETYQATTPKNRYATVLQLRRDHPKASIDEIAEQLAALVGAPVTPEAFRKNLQRARAKFIELLVVELKETIHPTDNADVEAEIHDLGLGRLYRRYSTGVDH